MKKVILGFFALACSNLVISQKQSIGIGINAGLGEIKKVEKENFPIPSNHIFTNPAPTWGFYVDGRKKLSNRFGIDAKIGYTYLASDEIEEYIITNIETNEVERYHAQTNIKAHYLNLRTGLNIMLSKRWNTGFDVSLDYRLTNSWYTEVYQGINPVPVMIMQGGNTLNKIDVGIHPRVGFKVTERLDLTAEASFGLLNARPNYDKDIYEHMTSLESGQSFNFKTRRYTIGLRYALFQS